MAENDFLVWGASGGNVMSQASYAGNAALANGVTTGLADPTLYNKSQRQSSIMAAMIADFIVGQTGADVIDDGTTAAILGNFAAALETIGFPTKVASLSANTTLIGTAGGAAGYFYNITATGLTIGLNSATFVSGQTVGFYAEFATTIEPSTGTLYGGSLSGTSLVMGAGAFITLQFDGTNWRQIAGSFLAGYGLLAANNAWTGTNSFSQTVTAGAGVTVSGADAGALHFRMTSAQYGAGWRIDSSNAYFLITAVNTPNGSFNTLRPFSVSLATGALNFDGTGAGVNFGGDVTAAGRLISIGSSNPHAGILAGSAQVSNPIANQTGGLQTLSNGSTQIYTAGASPLSIGLGTLGTVLGFFWGNTSMGSVSTSNGSSVVYNTTSDYRLKVTFGEIDSTGTIIDAVPIYDGAFKTDPGARRPMLLAHELAAALPHVVSGDKDAIDEDGKLIPQMVDYLALVPVLWAEVRALRKRLASAESQLAELTAPKSETPDHEVP